MAEFVDRELATHAPNYGEKLRAAFRTWNEIADANGTATLILPLTGVIRQRSVDWSALPAAIRDPVDAILDNAISARAPSDWGCLVGDIDAEDAELGMAEVTMGLGETLGSTDGALVIEPGTCRNWRDSVKRAWQAAADDPKVTVKPLTLIELFDPEVIKATIRGVRTTRRQRSDARSEPSDPQVKGRYEHTLVEALCAVGRATGVPAEILAPIETMKRNIDPAIVGWKRSADGGMKAVYAERRIGRRHADMLRQFNQESALCRWFETPQTLWRESRRRAKASLASAALARSALIAQIGQRVAPLRRINHARLRDRGPDAHLQLPVGRGHGWLVVPPIETKTNSEIRVRIDPETVQMIKDYERDYREITHKAAGAADNNPHLFPGAAGKEPEFGGYALGMGFISPGKLNTTFARHLKKYCRLRLCLHVMRHISGKVILDQDPSAMALVQVNLGHKTIKTTQSYYAEVSAIVAQARYLHLLEQGMRRALRDWTYKIIPIEAKKGKR